MHISYNLARVLVQNSLNGHYVDPIELEMARRCIKLHVAKQISKSRQSGEDDEEAIQSDEIEEPSVEHENLPYEKLLERADGCRRKPRGPRPATVQLDLSRVLREVPVQS